MFRRHYGQRNIVDYRETPIFPRFRGNSSTQTYDVHECAVGLPTGVANGESGPHEGNVCSQRQRMRPRDAVVTVQRKERC